MALKKDSANFKPKGKKHQRHLDKSALSIQEVKSNKRKKQSTSILEETKKKSSTETSMVVNKDNTHLKKKLKRLKWKHKQKEKKLQRLQQRQSNSLPEKGEKKNKATKKLDNTNKKPQTSNMTGKLLKSEKNKQAKDEMIETPVLKVKTSKSVEEASSNWRKLHDVSVQWSSDFLLLL